MASSPKPPKAVDPNTIISAEESANRVNRITPFGSQTYGPDGSLTTTLPQGTQNAFNNITNMAGNQQQFLQTPSGAGDLQSAIMNKITNRYTQPQAGQKAGPQSMSAPMMGQSMGGNAMPSPQAWSGALNQIWGNH